RLQQRLRHLAVALGARELVDGLTVPIQAEPGEPIEDGLDRSLRGALAVGVLDPQQHLPAAPAGVEPVEQRRARPPDMQKARWRRSKTRDDGLGHIGWSLRRSASLMLWRPESGAQEALAACKARPSISGLRVAQK